MRDAKDTRAAGAASVIEPLAYDWRHQSSATVRGGFYASVEKFWCTPGQPGEFEDEDGWRWSGFEINSQGKPGALRSTLSYPMSLSAAQAEAENWIQDQIDRAEGLAVYAFAGLDPATEDARRAYVDDLARGSREDARSAK